MMKSVFLFLVIILFTVSLVVAQDTESDMPTDNWCDAGNIWDDGRCNTGSANEQEWHWICGWYMAQVDNGFFTIEELRNNLPLCESLYPPENIPETNSSSANSQPNNPPNDCVPTDPNDSDCDGLHDTWEYNNFGNLNQNATDDPDGDNCDNLCEFINGTDPSGWVGEDADNDGLLNGEETAIHGTNPLDSDTDGDGLYDGDEVHTYGTNPNSRDTDDDGLTDYEEVILGTDPLDEDTDDDGLSDSNDNCPTVAGTAANNGCP